VTSSVSGKRSPAELIARGPILEVETGIEPVCTALQAVASPLGHSTAGLMPLHLRADDGIRTRDPHLGKVMRYQLRYIRAPRTTSSPIAKDDDSPLKRSRTNLNSCGQAGVLDRSERLTGLPLPQNTPGHRATVTRCVCPSVRTSRVRVGSPRVLVFDVVRPVSVGPSVS
jgi:hypothetical protein